MKRLCRKRFGRAWIGCIVSSTQKTEAGAGETDDSHPFMTAMPVVAGLVQARAAGSQVRQETIDKGVAWMKKDFAADPKLVADLRAYMVYALAVAGQGGFGFSRRSL